MCLVAPAGICSESRLALELLRNLMSQALKGSRPRVLIADDHAMFAETLREFLTAKYDVVGLLPMALLFSSRRQN